MKYFLFIPILFLTICAKAQEIKMNVTVKVNEAKLADPRVFKTLENAISEFYNLTQFTEDEFEDDERIEANLQIIINEELSTTSFNADFIFQVLRPVFNSNYTTQTLNHVDNSVSFQYQELQPLQNNTDVYTDNLSSILTFYAYIMLGTDYDSFSPLGGEEFYDLAYTVMNNIPINNSDDSWRPKPNTRNRNTLINNLLHPSMKPYRQGFYEYHRQSLDIMHEDALKGRAIIASVLETFQGVENNYPNSMPIRIFCDSKSEEIVQIFLPAKSQEKNKIYKIMIDINPAQANDYVPLKK